MNSSRNSEVCLSNACKKKKKKCQTQTRWVFQANPNVTQIRGDLAKSQQFLAEKIVESGEKMQNPATFSFFYLFFIFYFFFFQIWMLSLFQQPTRPDHRSPSPETDSTNFSDGSSPYWVQNRLDSIRGQPYYYLSAQFVFHVDYTITLKNLANIV